MKPIFIKPLEEEIKYRGKLIKNDTINISMCSSFRKTQKNWYPDNEGIPSITFQFDGYSVEWTFNNEKERQDCEDHILSFFGNTNTL